MEDVVVIIPALNEEAKIAQVVSDVTRQLPLATVVVIDDGSTDNTAQLARQTGATVLSHANALGYGTAIQTGYKYAYKNGYNYLVQIDGDGQHESTDIHNLLNPVLAGEADLTLGSRFLGDCRYQVPIFRRIGMTFFRMLTYLFTRRHISDPTTGYQAMNRRVIGVFVQDIFPCDYPDADVIVLLDKLNFSFKEVPVTMHAGDPGNSMHGNPFGAMYYLFKMVVSMFLTRYRALPKNLV